MYFWNGGQGHLFLYACVWHTTKSYYYYFFPKVDHFEVKKRVTDRSCSLHAILWVECVMATEHRDCYQCAHCWNMLGWETVCVVAVLGVSLMMMVFVVGPIHLLKALTISRLSRWGESDYNMQWYFDIYTVVTFSDSGFISSLMLVVFPL